MATRIKTVQYAFPMYTSLVADSTTTDLTQITIDIPETVVAFSSVTAELGFQDVITATGGTIANHNIGLRLGAAAYTTISNSSAITHSGENIAGVVGPFDFTSHFTSNWSGTSMTCDSQVYFHQSTGTTLGMRNVTVVLTITYQYDDTAATHAKTVWIPLESKSGGLTNTQGSSYGFGQIPQLTASGGMLPESSITIKDYYFLIEGNTTVNNDTTDLTISASISYGPITTFGTIENALGSDRYCRWIYKPASVADTTTSHDFQLWQDYILGALDNVTVTLVVTYTFDTSTSTRVLNSLILPFELSSPLGNTTVAKASRISRDFYIDEPGTITLKQSGIRINYNAAASPGNLRIQAAGQTSFSQFTPIIATSAGMFSVQQRLDTGSTAGGHISLTNGKNSLVVDAFTTSAGNQISNVSGYFIINYQSGIATSGVGSHAHTVFKNVLSWVPALSDYTYVTSFAFDIPESPLVTASSTYFVIGLGFIFYQFVQTASMGIIFDAECLTTEAMGGGYYNIYADAYQADNERGNSVVWMRGRDAFQRYPNDPDSANRVVPETSRAYRLFTSTTTSNGLMSVITYNSISYTVSGTISGSAGGTVEIYAYRSDTRELIYHTSRTGNGSYSFKWHDDTIALYVEAREDNTHYGRSIDATAGTSLDVTLSSTSVTPVVRSHA